MHRSVYNPIDEAFVEVKASRISQEHLASLEIATHPKTAKALELTAPQAILTLADRVIR